MSSTDINLYYSMLMKNQFLQERRPRNKEFNLACLNLSAKGQLETDAPQKGRKEEISMRNS